MTGTSTTAALLEKSSALLGNYRQPPVVMARGLGCEIWDTDGKRYVDFSGGIAVLSVGHCHPVLAGAIAEQAKTLLHTSNLFFTNTELEFASALTEVTGFAKVYFANSGTEANEALFKLARRYHYDRGDKQRIEVVSTINGFHGRTMGALALTGQPKYHVGFEPLIPGVHHVVYNDIAALEKVVEGRTAAVILEPIQAEGGIIVGTDEYLKAARAICDRHGALLFFDEVQTGYGRTGKFLGAEWSGVRADAISLAKGIGGGFPLAAMLVDQKLAGALPQGSHGSTFGGNPLACAAGLAVLKIISSEGLVANAAAQGEYLSNALEQLASDATIPAVEARRGRGLLQGLKVPSAYDPMTLVASLRANGLLVSIAGGDVLRLAPPLNVQKSTIDEAISILSSTLKAAIPKPV